MNDATTTDTTAAAAAATTATAGAATAAPAASTANPAIAELQKLIAAETVAEVKAALIADLARLEAPLKAKAESFWQTLEQHIKEESKTAFAEIKAAFGEIKAYL